MNFLVNELSIIIQAKNKSDADLLMKNLITIIQKVQPMCGNDLIRTHSILLSCKITEHYSVYEWLQEKLNSASERDLGRALVGILKNKIDKFLNQKLLYWECQFNGQDCCESSLAGAAYLKGVLISLGNSKDFLSEYINLEFRLDENPPKTIRILNLTDLNQFIVYVPSSKHRNQGERGRKGTLMDLSDIEAQEVLDESYINNWFKGKKYYGYKNGKFYEFKTDNAGTYHGYPVERGKVPIQELTDL